MTSYSSQPVKVDASAMAVYERLSDVEAFGHRIEQLPDDVRSRLGDVEFTADAIIIKSAPMGQIVLAVTERIPAERIAFTAQSAPVPMILAINLKAIDDNSTEVVTAIDVDIPAILKPMVGPKLQEAANKMGEMVANISKL